MCVHTASPRFPWWRPIAQEVLCDVAVLESSRFNLSFIKSNLCPVLCFPSWIYLFSLALSGHVKSSCCASHCPCMSWFLWLDFCRSEYLFGWKLFLFTSAKSLDLKVVGVLFVFVLFSVFFHISISSESHICLLSSSLCACLQGTLFDPPFPLQGDSGILCTSLWIPAFHHILTFIHWLFFVS